MLTKIDIRNIIKIDKDKYIMSNDKYFLIEAAILKGLYLAIGGEKGILIPNKYSKIVTYSKIIFKYSLKTKNKDKAYKELSESLIRLNKMPDYYIGSTLNISNEQLAKSLVSLILSEYTDELDINSNEIYKISLNIIQKVRD